MPVDFATLKDQVSRKVASYQAQTQRIQGLVKQAQDALRHPPEKERLSALVDQAVQADKTWRGAAPTDESPGETFPPPAAPDLEQVVVLAADGSQINPDPHGEVYFGLVNLGLVVMDRHHTPITLVRSHLLLSELHESEGFEASVLLRRDLYERLGLAWAAALLCGDEAVLDKARASFHQLQWDPAGIQPAELERFRTFHPQPARLVALTDGPLELWGPRREEGYGDFSRTLERYQEALGYLKDLGVLQAGYVDNPRADLVVRMLELTLPAEAREEAANPRRPWSGVRDRDLWAGTLPPGYRTALFQIRAQYLADYNADLHPYFFYLNVGTPDRPALARVELPAWVAQDADAVALVHAVLLWQGRIVPGRLYPYILHRAHETAVVTQDDRRQVTWMVQQELLRQGLPFDRRSQKQRAKNDAAKRNRYER